jgi:hypothetical protein
MPITVCLAVLGRHVEGLEFLDVLLGDKPALTPEQSFYQRALIGDAAEATYQAELSLKDQSQETNLADVSLGGLKLAERDARRGALDEEQAQRIAKTVDEMLDNLADFEPRRWFSSLRQSDAKDNGEENGGLAALGTEAEPAHAEHVFDRASFAPGWAVETPVLVIGGRSKLDEAAGAMLTAVLSKLGLGAKTLSPEAISAGHITTLSGTEAKIVCLSYLGLGTGPAHIRYLVRRLRRILPKETCILVAYWNEGGETATVKALLDTAGADAYATSLHEALEVCEKAARGDLECAADAPAVAKTDDKPKETAASPKPKGKKSPARVA